jgi:hypothetical protein
MSTIKSHCLYRVRAPFSVLSAILSFGILFCSSTLAQTIHLRVLNGRNGRPISSERVQVWIDITMDGNTQVIPRQLSTDSNGQAELYVGGATTIRIASIDYFDCRPFRKNAPRPTYSVAEILSSGLATANRCGKPRVEARPGEVVFFVRPFTWWEELKRRD